jgi:uncharacterized membrane protein AbrB (regulator of aidB expression)
VTLAATEPGVGRLLAVVVAATLTTLLATGWGVQAPFVVGAASLVAVTLGRLIEALPWPGLLGTAVAGIVLVGVGAGYESRRQQARDVAGRVADLR